MEQLLDTNLYVGGIGGRATALLDDWAVVHATQTVHYQIFGWDFKNNKPPKNHDNYIYYEEDDRLSLNWIDGRAYLYNWSKPKTFNKVLDFIDKWIDKKKVCVHCDVGRSRSPSLALLYLSKRTSHITDKSFLDAKREFERIYPQYSPNGIGRYIDEHWDEIN